LVHWTRFAATAGLVVGLPLAALAQEVQPEAAAPEVSAAQAPVVLEADSVYEISETNSVVAEGNVEAAYEGRILRADKIVYNRVTDKVRATGNVVIIDTDGTQQFADEMEVNSKLSDGYAIGFSSRLPDGSTIVANTAIRQKDGVNALDQVIYTSCPVCEDKQTPTWALRSRRTVLDQQTQMISYRDAVFEVAGIPVLYFPYFAHPDPNSGRRSGLLVPSLGVSSKIGAFYQQPYYWAYSDSADLTVSPLIAENVNPALELDWRKRFFSGDVRINTSFTNESDFDSEGEKFGEKKFRGHVYGAGRFAITPNWQWGFGVENQTDDLYDRRYDIDGQGEKRGLYASQPRRLLSQLFITGQGDQYYTDASVLKFQGLRGGDDDANLPLASPIFFGEKYWNLGDLGFAAINASSSVLTREAGINSRRVSVGAEWSDLNVVAGGFTVEPFAELRGDYYSLSRSVLDDELDQKDVTRAVGNAGVRIAYPMVRPGDTVDVMLEPTVMAAWGFSNVNNDGIPNEDSTLYESDESSLFQANGFGNYDLYEGDGKVSAGVTARAVFKNGPEFSTTVGRRWRSRSDAAFDVGSNLDGTASDWIGAASVDFGDILRADTRVRLDDDGFKLNRIDARLSTQTKRFRAVGQYYKIVDEISPLGVGDEGIFLRGEVKLIKNYSLIFGTLRDITDNIDANQELGIAFEDECSRFELVYQRSELRDRTLGPSNNVQFRFTLKSIGNFGSSEFD
jgi:LPS-assembly protein